MNTWRYGLANSDVIACVFVPDGTRRIFCVRDVPGDFAYLTFLPLADLPYGGFAAIPPGSRTKWQVLSDIAGHYG